MKKIYFHLIFFSVVLSACNNAENQFDAQGTFEADEVIVSSEIPGKLVAFDLQEGQTIPKDSVVGSVDATNLVLQKEQVEASIGSLNEKTADVGPQVKMLQDQLSVQQSQMQNMLH